MHPRSSNLCCSRATVNPQFNIYSIYIPNLTSLTSSTVPMVAQATTISHLDQGSANYNLWAKSGPTPICVNKVLLETAMFIHLHTVYGCFCPTAEELNSGGRDNMTRKTETINCLAFSRSLLAPDSDYCRQLINLPASTLAYPPPSSLSSIQQAKGSC